MLRKIIIAYLIALLPVIYVLFFIQVAVYIPLHITSGSDSYIGTFTRHLPDADKSLYLNEEKIRYHLTGRNNVVMILTKQVLKADQTIYLTQYHNIFQKITHPFND